jgi:hypothetical protein
MPRVIAEPALDPAALDASARDALVDRLYPVHCEIFSGVSRGDFRAYVVDSPAQRTRIQVFRSEDGRAVGYVATHVFLVDTGGEPVAVLRSEAGFLREARGQTAAGRLLLSEALGMRLRHPGRRCCFLACPIHPASYYALARTSPAVWPRPEADTPADVQALMDGLDGALHLEEATGALEGVRKVGWVTRQTDAEAASWAAHEGELVRYYHQQNPGYVGGSGLRVVAPIELRTVLSAGAAFVRRQLLRLLDGLRPAGALQLPAGTR